MNYSKPAVNNLGDATTVIESINPLKPVGQPADWGTNKTLPAYDLDE